MACAVAIKNGYARRIDIKTGSDRGSIGSSGVSGCFVSGGIAILMYGTKGSSRYDAKTGPDKGSV
jgi:hypothetical protein